MKSGSGGVSAESRRVLEFPVGEGSLLELRDEAPEVRSATHGTRGEDNSAARDHITPVSGLILEFF